MADRQPKGGRPKIELTEEQCELAETLAGMQCTHAEIAAVLKVSEDTITRRKQDDPSFADAIKRGQENGKASIRRMQYKAAKDGNATMQIWLGKQYLNQTDKREDRVLHQTVEDMTDADLADIARRGSSRVTKKKDSKANVH